MTEELNTEQETTQDDFSDLDVPEEEALEAEGDTSTPDEKPGEPAQEAAPPQDDFSEKVSTLERKVAGLTQGLRAERSKRQEAQGRLSQVTELIVASRGRRGDQNAPDTPAVPKKIPVQFDEDGTPYVLPEHLTELTAPETKQLKAEIESLKRDAAMSKHQVEMRTQFNSVVAEKPEYHERFESLRAANQAINQMFAEYVQDTGTRPPQNIDQALDIIEQAGLDKQFSRRFPNVALEDAIEAFVSPRKLRRVLSSMTSTSSGGNGNGDGRKGLQTLQGIASKPGSHVGRGGGLSEGSGLTLNNIANMDQDDIDNLSEAEIRKIERLMKQQEFS